MGTVLVREVPPMGTRGSQGSLLPALREARPWNWLGSAELALPGPASLCPWRVSHSGLVGRGSFQQPPHPRRLRGSLAPERPGPGSAHGLGVEAGGLWLTNEASEWEGVCGSKGS